MIEILYAFIIAFLVLNTVSFYLLDYITDRMIIEKAKELTPKELSIYVYIRLVAGAAAVGVVVMIVLNLGQILMRIF